MSVREFKLINEKGQEFSLMDIENYCLMTEPSGIGIEYSAEYEQLNNRFIENIKTIGQEAITGQVNFTSYDNYKKLADFILSDKIKIVYTIPYEQGERTFYRDISVTRLTKSEKNIYKILSETIVFMPLSLWYEKSNIVYKIGMEDSEIRWDFKWDSKFASNDIRSLKYINQGHTDADIYLEIDGEILNPVIELYVENELYQSVKIKTLINKYEKLIYNTQDFEISRIKTDGTKESLFSLDIIDFSNDNVIRIPPKKSCEIRLKADNNIDSARLSVYSYYVAV